MDIKSKIKIAFNYLIIIIITFVLAEILSRAFFPEFSKNQVYHKINDNNIFSKGQNQYFNYIQNLKYRSKTSYKEKFNFDEKTIWLFGDSVTNGYALKYTETYYYQLSTILKNLGYNFNIIATSGYGSDLQDAINVIKNNKNLFKKHDLIIYQFNYNDILPHKKRSEERKLKTYVHHEKAFLGKLIKHTNEFRYAYLNYSSFLRTLQHYAGIFIKKTSGTCYKREKHALGMYSYAFGSKRYKKISLEAWDEFYENIKSLKKITSDLNNEFIVLISPISLQLPNHENNNMLNFNLDCATIDPYKKFKQILLELNIKYSDPLPLFLDNINIDINEKNSPILFHEHDTNHPNAKANLLLAYSLLNKIIKVNY